MRLADFHAHREQISARRQLRHYERFRFNMAETVSSAARDAPSREGWTDSDSPEQEEVGDDAELLQCQLQLGTPREMENAELVAEVEAVAAGWMLDFLCLSLCRAFRDGRSEDFRRTRDSAEGECGLPGRRLRRGRDLLAPHTPGRDPRRETARNRPLPVCWKSWLPPPRLPRPLDRMFVCLF